MRSSATFENAAEKVKFNFAPLLHPSKSQAIEIKSLMAGVRSASKADIP